MKRRRKWVGHEDFLKNPRPKILEKFGWIFKNPAAEQGLRDLVTLPHTFYKDENQVRKGISVLRLRGI